MADLLYYNGVLLGDQIIRPVSRTFLATPPKPQCGLFQPNAQIVSTSQNIVHAKTFIVTLKRGTHWLFDKQVEAIQRMLGQTYTIELKADNTVFMRWSGATFYEAPDPQTSGNHGARFVEEWPLSFFASQKPEWL